MKKDNEKIIDNIKLELKKNIDLKYKNNCYRFYKEKTKSFGLGVKTPIVRKISKKYFNEIKHLDKKQIFDLCEKLLKLGHNEGAIIAFEWAFKLGELYQKSDFWIFEDWLKKYISNWGDCDDFSTHPLGYFIFQYPEFITELKKWAKAENRWLRRASAVSLIYSIRKRRYLKHIFEISDILLLDEDDLVQKGYGWMLKEASNLYPKEIFNYVMKNKNKMPRVSLRYAIEKLPDDLRKKCLKR